MSFRFCFIDQHTLRNIVDEIARCNSDQLHAFFFPQMYDLPFDNFTRMHAETARGRLQQNLGSRRKTLGVGIVSE
jgi:hypothetical protein